jgi:hypothetical protein
MGFGLGFGLGGDFVKKFVLMKRDTEVMRFDVGDKYFSDLEIVGEMHDLPPIFLSGGELSDFLFLRFGKMKSPALMKHLGLSGWDLGGVIQKTFGLSLLDDYWMAPVGVKAHWNDLDLRTNEWTFDVFGVKEKKAVGGIELIPEPIFGSYDFFAGWEKGEDGARYVIGDSYGLPYVSQLANRVQVRFPDWKPMSEGMKFVWSKPNFQDGVDLIPLNQFLYDSTVVDALNFFGLLGGKSFHDLVSAIVFERVVFGAVSVLTGFCVRRGSGGVLLDGLEPIFGGRGSNISKYDEYFAAVARGLRIDWVESLVDFSFDEIEGCEISGAFLNKMKKDICGRASDFLELMMNVGVGSQVKEGRGTGALNVF